MWQYSSPAVLLLSPKISVLTQTWSKLKEFAVFFTCSSSNNTLFFYWKLPFTLFLKFNLSKWNKWRLSIKLSDRSLILMSFCFKHVTDAWRILFQTSLHINKAIKLFQTLKNGLVWCQNPCGHLIIVTVSMWKRNQRGSSDMNWEWGTDLYLLSLFKSKAECGALWWTN